MTELGKRVANTNRYDEPEINGYKIAADVDQPLRTDQEKIDTGEWVPYLYSCRLVNRWIVQDNRH